MSLEMLTNPGKIIYVYRFTSAFPDPVDENGGINLSSAFLGIAHKIYFGYNGNVGEFEAGGKIVEQKPRPTVLVRLEDHPGPPPFVPVTDGPQGRGDLGGMMGWKVRMASAMAWGAAPPCQARAVAANALST